MFRVFKASGEEVLAIQFAALKERICGGDQPIRVLDLKRHLQGLCGQPRFRQQLLLPDGQMLPEDAVPRKPSGTLALFLELGFPFKIDN